MNTQVLPQEADAIIYAAPRMSQTMQKLQKMNEQEYSSFIRVLFGLSSPSPVPENLSTAPDTEKIEWISPDLNDSQKEAIRFALASREIALIHGPPGVRRILVQTRIGRACRHVTDVYHRLERRIL